MLYLKQISKAQINKLIIAGTIRSTSRGYENGRTGYHIGYYKTKGAASKRYIEDKYVDIANKLK